MSHSFKLSSIEMGSSGGLDSFLDSDPTIIEPFGTPATPRAIQAADRKAITTLADLAGFTRVASDTLIHKSTQDFWALNKSPDGSYFIERLIDGTAPVEG